MLANFQDPDVDRKFGEMFSPLLSLDDLKRVGFRPEWEWHQDFETDSPAVMLLYAGKFFVSIAQQMLGVADEEDTQAELQILLEALHGVLNESKVLTTVEDQTLQFLTGMKGPDAGMLREILAKHYKPKPAPAAPSADEYDPFAEE